MAASIARPLLIFLLLLLMGTILCSCEDSVSPPPGVEEAVLCVRYPESTTYEADDDAGFAYRKPDL